MATNGVMRATEMDQMITIIVSFFFSPKGSSVNNVTNIFKLLGPFVCNTATLSQSPTDVTSFMDDPLPQCSFNKNYVAFE